MEDARFQKIQDLFEQVVDLPSEQQRDFLKEACGEDATLFTEVWSLIMADETDAGLLDHNAADLVAGESQPLEGQVVGAYRVDRMLGLGGMGLVYRAERADGQFKQTVALKIIKRGMDTDEILYRFHSERQILASLKHPNIAALLDGGVTEDGRPYFTMEYVRGQPIDRYCDEHRLTIDQRLALFVKVCDAVSYAQQKLIVHRDLKPSNIIVTRDGQVKLLDFGIAKVLGEGAEDYDLTDITRTGMRVMTPGYASPEQIRGEPVTTASDVYSLGVVLYEILSGRRPYDLRTASALEIERAILNTSPIRPSSAVVQVGDAQSTSANGEGVEISEARSSDPHRLVKRLSGDLDNICLMALRKEADRRYHNAEQLLEDINRHLSGRPVIARPDTLAYRTQKFITRNRVAVSTAAVVVLVLIGIVSLYTWRLSVERDRARVEADKAAAVSNFLISIFDTSDPLESDGGAVTARELLDQGVKRVETELADQPEVKATMLQDLGTVYNNLGLIDKATPLLKESLNILMARDGKRGLPVSDAIYGLASNMYELGHYDSAIVLYRSAIDVRRKSGVLDDRTAGDIYNDMASAYRRRGDFDTADSLYHVALAIRRALFGEYNRDVAHSLNHLGRLYAQTGRYKEAEPILRKALQIRRKLLGDNHPETGASFGALAGLMMSTNRFAAAESLYTKCYEGLKSTMGPTHPYVMGAMASLASAKLSNGDTVGAEALYRECLKREEASLPKDHQNLAYPLLGLGNVFMHTHRVREAEPLLRKALAVRRKNLPKDHWQVAQATTLLGECLLIKGDLAGADTLLHQGFNDFLREIPDNRHYILTSCNLLIQLGEKMQDPKMITYFTGFRDSVRATAIP